MCCNFKPFLGEVILLHDILVNFEKEKTKKKFLKEKVLFWVVMASRASEGLNDSQSHYILAS